MKRLAAMFVVGTSTLLATVNANCGPLQKLQNGNCVACPTHTRGQEWQGQKNFYCQGDVCPDANSAVKSYINKADGTCQQCTGGTVPNKPNSNGLRTSCVTGGGAVNTCSGCLNYRDGAGNCQTCSGTTVVNFAKNGCTFRANCQPGQYYDACNACQTCAAGTTYNSVTKTCTATGGVTSCTCDKELSGGICVRCPQGRTSDNASKTCQIKNLNCHAQGQLQLDQSSCYNCANCQAGTVYNTLTKQCTAVAAPTSNCNCYQQRAAGGGCTNCPAGQISGNGGATQNLLCRVAQQNCHASGQIQLGQSQCYRCQACAAGQTFSAITNSCSQPVVVRSQCNCYQQFNAATNQCQNCPAGQLSGNSINGAQNGVCRVAQQNCHASGQIQLGQNSCYGCQACAAGQTFSAITNSCSVPVVVRPTCNCYQQFNAATNQCQNCPAGQLSGNGLGGAQNGVCRVAQQNCHASGQIQLGQNQCYQCQACAAGQVFSAITNSCTTQRPICNCYQQLNAATNQCQNCPNGQLSGNGGGVQNGVCRQATQNCNARGQIQLGQNQCYQCQSCSAGQVFTAINNSCTTPRPTCLCYQGYNQATNQCVNCPAGQLSGNQLGGTSNGQCRVAQQNCHASGQIQLGQNQCYQCQACAAGQVFSAITNSCTTPRPVCNCYQYYSQAGNQCLNCAAGQLSGNGGATQNGVCRQATQNCNARGQIQLGQNQCYQCQSCPSGQQIVGNTCRVPRPVCNCYQQYNQATNQCVNCNAGQLSGNGGAVQNGVCKASAQNCNARGQIQLGQTQCYQCQSCPLGQQLVGNTCRVPRPVCNCYQQYNQATNQCVTCNAGQLSGNNGAIQNGVCKVSAQNCNARGQIQLGQTQCYQCQACPVGQQLVGNVCRVPRPVCNCYQQYNSVNNSCQNCAAGQLSGNGGAVQNLVCKQSAQNCNARGQIQLGQTQCYQCQSCPVGQQLVGNTCRVPRPVCNCYQQYNPTNNQCQNCNAGQLSGNGGATQNGVCKNTSQNCNARGQIQLGQTQCYQCQACPLGQVLAGNNQCRVPRPTCRCFEFVNNNNQCQSCPLGQLAANNNSNCVAKINNCQTGNSVLGTQQSCYACTTCGVNQIPNASRTGCVARPFVTCGCLSRRSADGYSCIPCPAGQITNPNNLNACVAQPNCSQLSIRLPRDNTNCARCQQCNFPTQIPDATRTRCLVRPKANCDCTQRRSVDGYTCIQCPIGQIRDITNANQSTCVIPPTCNGTYAIRLAVDRVTCGRCQNCNYPTQIPDISRTTCIQRPFAVCNQCTQRQSNDRYSCVACPPGQVVALNRPQQCFTPTCPGTYAIRTAVNNVSCGKCATCPYPQQIPNATRTGCINRPLAVCTSCLQRQSDDGYSCVTCPAGQIQDPNNPRRCYATQCLGQYDIKLPVNAQQCGRCQPCQWPRQIPNQTRTACVNRPYAQCPDCLTKRTADNYSCERCPLGQVQDPTNMGRCLTRTCTGQYQIQLAINSQSCGRCDNCQWPRFMPDQFKTTCIARPLAVCNCRQKQSASGYECENCPAGYIQDVTNQKRCVRPSCGGQYQIQLSIDLNNCGRCETCQWPQFMPNGSRTQCVARPLATCNCQSRRSAQGYSCERCPANTIQDPNNMNACYVPICNGTYQIRRPLDATSCGKCEDCQWPRYIPNNQRTQCVLRPLADCDCLSKQSQDGYQCESCPFGQRQDPRNVKRCIPAPTCTGPNQVVGLRDLKTCYACRTCTAPFIPKPDRSMCYRPRPKCSCTQRYSADGYSCLACPAGQVSDNNRQSCYPAPGCTGPRQILGTISNCYRCNTCPSNLVPDANRRTCVRPIPVCTCTQRYSRDGYDCLECPNNQIVNPKNNKQCIPRVCNQRNQIFGKRDYCYRCEQCSSGWQPNPQRTQCVRIKPKCTCTEIYDQSGYVCVPCPPWQVAVNNNQRCAPRQCSGQNEILGSADRCYACKQCAKGSTPDNLRRRCLRYIVTACTCNQRFDDSGFGCVDCPAGTRPAMDNRSCVSLNCDKDQIMRRDLLCPQCEWCPPGSIPDPKRENCIIKPRPTISVNGKPSCDEFSVFNIDKTECIKCPNNLKSSADRLRCLNSCTDPLDIVQQDGTCFTCCNGNVPNYSRTRCIKKVTTVAGGCTGDREIFSTGRTRCTPCGPYTRAQRQNTVCLSDTCNNNQIVTWLGTCANCLAGETKVDQYTCRRAGAATNLKAQLVAEPTEEVSAAKNEKSFPTAIVVGLGILIMALSAVTGLICLRSRGKTSDSSVVHEEQVAQAEVRSAPHNDVQSIEHLTQVVEQNPEGHTSESGSGKNSE